MSNCQPISHTDYDADGRLHLHHIFPTIQGEGPYAGTPAIFVRLAGCNLQCPACDTDYTNSDPRKVSPADIISAVHSFVPRLWPNPGVLVVITGGEPFRQNIVPLCQLLLSSGYRVQIETNGTLWLKDIEVLCGLYPADFTIVCSPKTGAVAGGMFLHAKHWKYVIQAGQVGTDGLPLTTMMKNGPVCRPPNNVTVYVQPLDEINCFTKPGVITQSVIETTNLDNLKACTKSALRFGYHLSVQTHKLANLE